MAAGRVKHWKHGWIPISAEAKAYVAGKGPKPVIANPLPKSHADRLARARERQRAAGIVPPADDGGVRSMQQGGYRLSLVDGTEDTVLFKEPIEVTRRPPEQYREVAEVVKQVMDQFPKAKRPVTIGFSEEMDPDTLADTRADKPHKVRVNVKMWDKPEAFWNDLNVMRDNRYGLTAELVESDLDRETQLGQFRANVITHEIGHVLHMQEQDNQFIPAARSDDGSDQMSDGPVDAYAYEYITPRSIDYPNTPANRAFLDKKMPRYKIDSLGGRSAYALEEVHEFVAEAFTDGFVNDASVSDSGRKVLALLKQEFGGE